MTTTASTTVSRTPLSRVNRAGLVIAALLGLVDVLLNLPVSAPPPGEVGPPVGILVLAMVLGVVTLVAVGWAWRTASRAALRLASGARVLSVITALPAFFVDVPMVVKALVALFVVVTFAAVVLMLTPARRTGSVVD